MSGGERDKKSVSSFCLATFFISHKSLTLNAAVEGAEVGKSGQGAWSISLFLFSISYKRNLCSYSSLSKSSNPTKNLYKSPLKVVVIFAPIRKITELVRWSWISRRSNSLWVIEDQKEEDMRDDHAAGQNHPVMWVLLQLCSWSDHLRCWSPTTTPDPSNEIGKSSGQVYASKREKMQNVVQCQLVADRWCCFSSR